MTNINTERYLDTPEVQSKIGHDVILNADPSRVRHETYYAEVDSDRLEGEQPIHVGIVEPLSGQPDNVFFVPVAWSDYSNRVFQSGRLDLMAQHTNSRVIGIDFPGMGGSRGERGDELSEKNIEELKQGRMSELAKTYWDVLANKAGALTDESGDTLPVVMWLNSMSTLTGAELVAAAPDGVRISDIYFSESMALLKRNVGALALQFMKDGAKHQADYYESNKGFAVDEGSFSNFLIRVNKQKQSHYRALQALARGKQSEIMNQAFKEDNGVLVPDTKIHIVRASDGLVNESAHNRFVAEMSAQNVQVRADTLDGEGHAWEDSMPMLLAQLDRLSDK